MRAERLCFHFAAACFVLLGTPVGVMGQVCSPCWSDLSGDGLVGQADLGQLLGDWGEEYTTAWQPDEYTVALWYLNGNGTDFSGNGNDLTVKHDRVAWGADGGQSVVAGQPSQFAGQRSPQDIAATRQDLLHREEEWGTFIGGIFSVRSMSPEARSI